MTNELLRVLRERWRQLVATDLLMKLVSLLALAPLYTLVLRAAVATSGAKTLTDTDLLYFVVSPLGLAGGIVVLSLAVAMVALHFSSLLVGLAWAPDQPRPVIGVIKHTLARGTDILRLAVRIVIELALWLAPVIIIAGLTYAVLLSEFDINYYLKERPPAFWAAAAIAIVLLAAVVAIVLRTISRWFFALPLVLFEEVPPSEAGAESRRRIEGRRATVLGWLVAAGLFVTLVSGLLLAAPLLLLDYLADQPHASLAWMAAVLGACLALSALAGLVSNVLSNLVYAGLLDRLYVRVGGGGDRDPLGSQSSANPLLDSLLSRRGLTVGVVVGALAALVVGFATIATLPMEDRVEVIGHRGAPTVAPENTLAAVEAAIDAGADWVEIDVQELADGTVVVFHDSDFMKSSSVDLKIWDATPEDLQRIDVGARFSEEFAGERVPTFADVLRACRGRAGVLVELKYYGHDVRLEERVAELVEQHEMVDQTEFMSLKKEGVAKLKALRPGWEVGLLMSVAVGSTEKLEADFLALNASFASRDKIRREHASGRRVYVWTVNDPVQMSSLISSGVDGLITDRPDLARRVLAERAELTLPQRLVIDLAARL